IEMLIKIPTEIIVITTDVPPRDKNGSQSPTTGSSPTFIAILIQMCQKKSAEIPTAHKTPNRSRAKRAIRSDQNKKPTYSTNNALLPRNPNCSAVCVKMKSLSSYGTKPP